MEAAEEAADAGDPRVALGGEGGAGARLGVGAHGAELHDAEGAPLPPEPLLEEEDRARSVELDREGAEEEEGEAEEEREGGEPVVESTFDRAIPREAVAEAHFEERHPGDLLQFDVPDQDLVEVRQDGDPHPRGGDPDHEIGDLVAREFGRRDHELRHVALPHPVGERLDEHVEIGPRRRHVSVELVVAGGERLEVASDRPRLLPRAEDERARRFARGRGERLRRRAPEGERRDAEEPGDEEYRARDLEGAVIEDEGHRGEVAEGNRLRRTPEDIEVGEVRFESVEVVEIGREKDDQGDGERDPEVGVEVVGVDPA